jgi:hypothetical protein
VFASRRWSLIALCSAGAVLLAVAIGVTLIRSHGGAGSATPPSGDDLRKGAVAVVDTNPYDIGVIDSPQEFHHTFLIRNEGSAPLTLKRGPSTCQCTLSEVSETPVPPGGQHEVAVSFTEAAMKDTLKPGPFKESMHVITNDPKQEAIELKILATVRRYFVAEPSPVVLSLHWSDLASEEKRSAETLLYSQRWEHFELEEKKLEEGTAPLAGLTWRSEPATPEQLEKVQGRSGYRIHVTLPPEMPDGQFATTLGFVAKPTGNGEEADGQPHTLELKFQGNVHGRLVFSGPKITDTRVLWLGSLTRGTPVRERVLMKVNEEPRALTIKEIETEPKFLRVHVAPYNGESAAIGLYRLDVEIPADAPSGNFTGDHQGVIRLKTDHPKFPVIVLSVDFAVVARGPASHAAP